MAHVPDLLTVEEAAAVLRVGRTKAYAMAREWRATGGRCGLPVVDLGHVLRVPRCQLEAIVGGPLVANDEPMVATNPPAIGSPAHETAESPTQSAEPRATTASRTRRRRDSRRADNQLDLFDVTDATS